VARHGDAIFDSDSVDGMNGTTSQRPWRMRALMLVRSITSALAHSADGGFLNGLALAD